MPRTAAVQVPGESTAEQVDTEHSVDAALKAASTGRAHRVSKHRTPPPSPTVDDPMRPKNVGVNARPEMSYDEAMDAHAKAAAAGRPSKPILTPEGWVCPTKLSPNEAERKPLVRGR